MESWIGRINMAAKWTFLTNHALVLRMLALNPQITANEISLQIGITERAVRKIIADFYNAGYILKGKEGRRVRYAINLQMPVQDRTQKGKVVGDFLRSMV